MDSRTLYRYKKAFRTEDVDENLADMVFNSDRRRETYYELLAFSMFKTAAKKAGIANHAEFEKYVESKKVDSTHKSGSGFDVSTLAQENSKLKSQLKELTEAYNCIEEAREREKEASKAVYEREAKTHAVFTKHKIKNIEHLDKVLSKLPEAPVDPLTVFPFGVTIPKHVSESFITQMQQDCDNAEEVHTELQSFAKAFAAALEK